MEEEHADRCRLDEIAQGLTSWLGMTTGALRSDVRRGRLPAGGVPGEERWLTR
jgi:hypothetical protein